MRAQHDGRLSGVLGVKGRAEKSIDIYIRVSRVGGREHLISPDEQERRGRDHLASLGLSVGKMLVDLDESGGKWDRPGLQEGLERVRSGQSGGLVVAWLDRLSRDSEHAHRLVREIAEAGGRMYAPDAPADWTSPEGELQAGLIFAFAQYVRKRSREGFERAKERSIAAGVPVNSRAPVGYRKKADRRLEPDPSTAPVIRELFERRAAGAGLSELARFLGDRGVRTSFGSSSWLPPSVAYVLSSRSYIGELSHGRDRRFVNPSAHEPLVDRATWDAAQQPKRRSRPQNRGTFLLAGLLRCESCGYAMAGSVYADGRRVYRCKKRHAGGLCPAPAWGRAEPLEDAARIAVFQDRSSTSESVNIVALEEDLARTERLLAQALSPEVQEAAGNSWGTMIAERRAEVTRASAAVGHAKVGRRQVIAADEWEKLPLAARRALLAETFDGFVLCRRPGRGNSDIVAFLAGEAPGLVRPTGAPSVRRIDVPGGARIEVLKHTGERVGAAA